MSMSLRFFDVASPIDMESKKGIVCVLHGDGSPLQYTMLMGNTIACGADVVAVAHGIDVTKEGGKAVIVFSTQERLEKGYLPDKTLDECTP